MAFPLFLMAKSNHHRTLRYLLFSMNNCSFHSLARWRPWLRVPKSATSQTCIVEGDQQQRSAVMVARTVVTQSGTSMPLRLLNWRRLMDMVLARVQWFNCLVYLDNLIIVGQTFQPTLSTESEGSVHLPEKCRTQAQTQ